MKNIVCCSEDATSLNILYCILVSTKEDNNNYNISCITWYCVSIYNRKKLLSQIILPIPHTVNATSPPPKTPPHQHQQCHPTAINGATPLPLAKSYHHASTSKVVFSSSSTNQSAKNHLLIKSLAFFDQISNSITTTLTAALPAAIPDCQITKFLAQLLAQGGTFEALLVLDGSTKACVILLHLSNTFCYLLVTPDRVIVDPACCLLQWKDCCLWPCQPMLSALVEFAANGGNIGSSVKGFAVWAADGTAEGHSKGIQEGLVGKVVDISWTCRDVGQLS